MKSILSDTTTKAKQSSRSSVEVLAAIQSVPIEHRIAWATAIGTEREVAEIEARCISTLTSHQGFEIELNNPDSRRGAFLLIGEDLEKGASLRWLSNALEAAPITIEARALLDPLHTELAEAKQREQEQAHQAARAAAAVEEAKDKARAEFEASLNDQPEVVEAVKKLEPFRRLGAMVE